MDPGFLERADGIDEEVESAQVQRRAARIFDYVDQGRTVLVRRYAKPRAIIMSWETYKRLKEQSRAGME